MLKAEPKIVCRHLWKVFGPDPEGFLKKHQMRPDAAAFAAEQYIGAVRDVSFDVMENEILVIMGLSGSGKSTLIRAITRLNDPTSGEVLMDGRNLLAASTDELIEIRRHKMGMVFQNFGLLPHRNVLDNVAFPLEVSGSDRASREAKAREMLKLVGLEGREGYFPRELSGGQQQRVGIARALALRPQALVLFDNVLGQYTLTCRDAARAEADIGARILGGGGQWQGGRDGGEEFSDHSGLLLGGERGGALVYPRRNFFGGHFMSV
jgi:glycine betaine/proline transport system ATP-binding protein